MSLLGKPIINPSVPYVGPLYSLSAGRFVRIVGKVTSIGKQFYSNLQCGSSHFDDVALHISIRLNEGRIVLKCQQFGTWQDEHTFENTDILRGKPFEILIICELTVYKIGINGQHLCEFPHKLPYERVSHIRVDGDVSLTQISVEAQPTLSPSVVTYTDMNSAPPPYPGATAPPPMGMPQATSAPYPPFNSAPQQQQYYPQTGQAAYNPLLPQQQMQPLPPPPLNSGAVNAMPRAYQSPGWQRWGASGRERRIALIVGGIFFAVFFIIFLVVLFTVIVPNIKQAQRRSEEFDKRWEQSLHEQDDFRRKHFPELYN